MEEQIYGGPSSSRLAQTIAGGKQLAGFNKHIASTMLLVIDEPTKFSVSLQQEFKNYITGDTQEVKEKYETAVFEANITNYAFTGNFLELPGTPDFPLLYPKPQLINPFPFIHSSISVDTSHRVANGYHL